jgi:cytochrome c-type biogenesis protein CcmH
VILFWVLAGLLALAVLAVLLFPLWRPKADAFEDRQAVVEAFRQELADVELDESGLSREEAAALRTEITRRLLASAGRESRRLKPGSRADTFWRIGAAAGVAGLLPVAAFALYFAYGTPAAIEPGKAPAASAGGAHEDGAALTAAVDGLRQKLARDPDHPRGWILLGRSLATLGRYGEAEEAYRRAIRLDPKEPGLHAELGEVLVLASGGAVTSLAKAEFARDPSDPRSRYYLAESALQKGETEKGVAALKALLAEAPQGAPWRTLVAQRLRQIEAAPASR